MERFNNDEPRRRLVIGLTVFVLAAAVRLTELGLGGLWRSPLQPEPSEEEVVLAQGLARGWGFVTPVRARDEFSSDPSAYSAPAYPCFLSGLIRLSGIVSESQPLPYRAGLIINALAGAVAVFLMATIVGSIGGWRAFLVMGVIGSFWPTLIRGSLRLWDTAFTVIVIVVGIGLALNPIPGHGSRREAAGWGALWGLCGLLNPITVPFFGLAAVGRLWNPRAAAESTRRVLLLGLVAAATVSPWLVRNAVVFKRFVPIRNTLGYTLWVGNLPGSDGTVDTIYKRSPFDNMDERQILRPMGEDAYMRMRSADGLRNIRAEPGRFIRLSFHRLDLLLFGNSRKPTRLFGYSFPMISGVNVVKVVLNVTLFALAIWGSIRWGCWRGVTICWIGLTLMALPFVVTHVSPNYRVYLDPVLLVLAAGVLCPARRQPGTIPPISIVEFPPVAGYRTPSM